MISPAFSSPSRTLTNWAECISSSMTIQARGKPSPVQAIPLIFVAARPFFEPSVFLTSHTPWSSGECCAADALAEPLSSFALAIFCPHNESNNFHGRGCSVQDRRHYRSRNSARQSHLIYINAVPLRDLIIKERYCAE